MKYRTYRSSLILALGLIFLCWIVFSKSTYFALLPVTFSPSGIPLIEVELNKNRYPLEIHLATKFALSLNKEVLEKIGCSSMGTSKYKDIEGKEHECKIFHLSCLKLDNLQFSNTETVEEDSTERIGYIGRPLLIKNNLLLDLNNSIIIATNDIKNLKKENYDIENFTQVPFKIEKKEGIILEIETDFGKKIFSLGTATSVNLIRPLKEIKNQKPITTARFILGKKDFGEQKFYEYEFTPELKMDGILGLEFIKSHAIYLDFRNKIAYIGKSFPKTYFVRLPVKLSHSNTPCIEAKIGDQSYLLLLDTGAETVFELKKQILDKPTGEMAKFFDIKGNTYESPLYHVAKISLGNLNFNNLSVQETNFTYKTKGSLLWDSSNRTDEELMNECDGKIGMRALKNLNLFFDFQKEVIFICDHFDKLAKEGYFLEEFIKAPFSFEKNRIVFNIKTDIGTKRFLLDTGATVSLIRPSLIKDPLPQKRGYGMPVFNTSKLRLGKTEFGPFDLHLFDITSLLENIDGILGMDFLKKHAIYLDFRKKEAYIRASS